MPTFKKVLEEKKITLFPTRKTRKYATRIACVEKCNVYCICRLPDSGGEDMICCDNLVPFYMFKH